jgi:hypothetical protein
MHPTYVHFMATASKHNYNQDNTTGNTKRYRGPNSRASVFSFTFFSDYSQANFVSKLLRQIANAWKAERG